MKVLITGAYGKLGSEIYRLIQRNCCPIGKIDKAFQKADIIRASSSELDISNLKIVLNSIKTIKPDLIINTAAYTDVDGCEKNPEKALLINSTGCRNLAIAASEINSKLVCISTDYVFSGESKTPYNEYDIPSPINVYGKTKLLGERYVEQFCNRYFIFRTSWLYGGIGNNFVKWVAQSARKNSQLRIVSDQTGSPTHVEDLAYHVLKISKTDEYGLYHCAGRGECSRFDLGKKIIEALNLPCTPIPIKSQDINQPAKRPEYSPLNNMLLRSMSEDCMRHYEEALKNYLSTIDNPPSKL